MDKKLELNMDNLRKECSKIEDPRKQGGNMRHGFFEIIGIALLAIISGCEEWIEIEDFAENKSEWLSTFLDLRNGLPSDDTYRRVFEALEPTKLEKLYRNWVLPYIGGCLGKQIAVDGKTSRGVGRGSGGAEKLHMVTAWVKEDEISLGQIMIDEKSNEIPAIPMLLDTLDIGGATVTIDAMGCQTDIAQCIRAREANYVLAVKQNQPTLHEDIKTYFDWAIEDSIEKKNLSVYKTQERAHGRITTRRTTVTNDVAWFEGKERWIDLKSFIMQESITSIKDKVTSETRFYISSLEGDAQIHARFIRGHWSIENQLHWRLDAQFGEDNSLIHKNHAPANLSILRKIALAILKKDTSRKMSVSRKQRLAAYDNSFLQHLLSLCE